MATVTPHSWISEATKINLDQLLNVQPSQLVGLGGKEFGIRVSSDEKSLILFELSSQLTSHPALFVGMTTHHYGKTIPKGWIWLNGRKLLYSNNDLPLLQAFLDGMYGADSFGYFIPDTRDRFERGFAGVSSGTDFSTRVARGDGISGGNVGTFQYSANKQHTHKVTVPSSSTPVASGAGSASSSPAEVSTDSSGGSESRPVNLNPWFIMWTGNPDYQDPSTSG